MLSSGTGNPHKSVGRDKPDAPRPTPTYLHKTSYSTLNKTFCPRLEAPLVTLSDWIPLVIALIGGSGGGALIAWINAGRQRRLDARQSTLDQRVDDLATLTAKKDLRKLVDDVAGEMITTLRADHKESINLVKEQQAEIHELYKRISIGDQKLLEASKQLAVAEAEGNRKEAVIVKLQSMVAALEATVTALRQQLAECAGQSTGTNDVG